MFKVGDIIRSYSIPNARFKIRVEKVGADLCEVELIEGQWDRWPNSTLFYLFENELYLETPSLTPEEWFDVQKVRNA